MARPLLLHAAADRTATSSPAGTPAPLVVVLLLVAAAAVSSVVVALCTSSKNAKPWMKHWRARGGGSPPAPQLEDHGGKKQLLASLSGIGGSKKQLLASLSGLGGKAAAVAKMVSWNRRSPPPGANWSNSSSRAGDEDGDQEDAAAAVGVVAGEEALWKKTIILGDKCRPLEFSGQITYDSDGNRLPPPPPAAAVESIKKSATANADDR